MKTKLNNKSEANILQPSLLKPKISIFGVGGAGGNALNNMIRSNLEGVEFIAANTDAQALSNSLAINRIQLGFNTTKGLGAGSFPDRGKAAAEENIEEIIQLLEGNNMIFITAGMGGGTGTGAAPVIAKLARERDILTVGVVTKPFQFEGKYRMEAAELGMTELKKFVDTLIVIPNQNLFRVANEQTTFESAFKMADNVLHAGVRGITDLITMPGLVNLDFADIRTIMTKMGKALMGTGEASGENRAIIACEEAISNPLLDDISIRGAKGVLVNMTGGPDMTLFEADLAVNTIKREVDANANIIFGSAFNDDMKGRIRISIVATGIDENEFSNIKATDNITDFYNSLKNNDDLKPRSNMVYEINNEYLKEEKNVISVAMQNKKTFFDPGMVKEIKDGVSSENLEVFNQSSEIKQQAEDVNVFIKEEKKIENETSNFFNQQDFIDIKNISADQKETSNLFKNVIEPIREEKSVNQDKKEGFSLFGFMNSRRKLNKEDKSSKNNSITIEEETEEEGFFVKNSNNSIQGNKNFTNKIKEGWLDEVSEKTSNQKEVKGQEISEDLTNIPAFFRRKKQ